ncbi:ubiquitin-specific protease UBP8 [Sugiyamaella lignohabitans]|uniref:ubiquitinyl hydrolase 1 n=1 Tax=Sugiyamaella lignohabitans TaxID=796027 RepID=A0A161HH72_9ASCO|nr:ubiquitin-specific protease UBP8 [Sugiyamaella lignohabitans]ANB11397.1 ubiquitin-specific protease UBP8 [Sugiyamaella lignohabitans]
MRKNGVAKIAKAAAGSDASPPVKSGRSGCVHTREEIRTKKSVILRSYELAVRLSLAGGGLFGENNRTSDRSHGINNGNDNGNRSEGSMSPSPSSPSKPPPRKRPRKGETGSGNRGSSINGSDGANRFNPKCGTCNKSGPLFLCLECSFTGCIDHVRDPHNQKTGHKLGVDISTRDGFLYCFACADYVIDDDFEQVRVKKIQQVFSISDATSEDPPPIEVKSVLDEDDEAGSNQSGRVKRQTDDYDNDYDASDNNHKPSKDDKNSIGRVTTSSNGLKPGESVIPSFQATTALKGFYNMGATCFMSVILQSLIHNPLVRNFFLAGGHDSDECEQPNCLACCVDQVFADFFANSSVQGFGMTAILTASFNLKKSLAGASEQDAHEFLQFILDEFHKTHFQGKVFDSVTETCRKHPLHIKQEQDLETNERDRTSTPTNGDETCQCVSHRTFYGQLESCIRCQTCGNVTATVDPMMDLSLEIKALPKKSKRTITLNDCLDRFTGSEKLDSTYFCSRCDTRRIADKQMFVKRLPTVLSIQLKVSKISIRFCHTHLLQITNTITEVRAREDVGQNRNSRRVPAVPGHEQIHQHWLERLVPVLRAVRRGVSPGQHQHWPLHLSHENPLRKCK